MNFQLGITQEFDCNYLPEQKERLIVAIDPRLQSSEQYSWLMTQGFRRSGSQIYRPYCLTCQACQSVRVLVNEFSPSKSQKRLLKKNKHFTSQIKSELSDQYYLLYESYINQIHQDGSMYPANYEQYKTFLSSGLTEQLFIEIHDNNQLIAVAVTDVLTDGLSAVYTFYNPSYRKQALGIYSILNQIDICQQMGKAFLYLGYQIAQCSKMNYKNRYFPYQILQENHWQTVNK